MTDKFKGWYPDYIENEKEREPILKLAKMMTGRAKKKLGLEKMTKYDPEYWGLALLCTDEQAEIALKMGVRQPKTLDQMVKVTGKDRGYLEKQLEVICVLVVFFCSFMFFTPRNEFVLLLTKSALSVSLGSVVDTGVNSNMIIA